MHFFMVGAVNLFVAYNYSMDTWVSFKLWSAFLFTILWAVLIGLIMHPYLKELEADVTTETSADDASEQNDERGRRETETTKTF
jgi:intracellular septation protein